MQTGQTTGVDIMDEEKTVKCTGEKEKNTGRGKFRKRRRLVAIRKVALLVQRGCFRLPLGLKSKASIPLFLILP